MNSIRFYFNHSLVGYFWRRANEKWFPNPSQKPGQRVKIEYHGVRLNVAQLPEQMREKVLKGYYEQYEMAMLASFINDTDSILEIGGAIGLVGLFCRKVKQVKEIVSVEPNPLTLSYLKTNYQLNGLTPSIIQAALTSSDGPIEMQVSDLFWCDSLHHRATVPNGRTIQVEGLSFQSIVDRVGFKFNTLILDVEGSEQFLPVDRLPESVKKIMIELHPDILGPPTAFGVLEKLILQGFHVVDQREDVWALTRA